MCMVVLFCCLFCNAISVSSYIMSTGEWWTENKSDGCNHSLIMAFVLKELRKGTKNLSLHGVPTKTHTELYLNKCPDCYPSNTLLGHSGEWFGCVFWGHPVVCTFEKLNYGPFPVGIMLELFIRRCLHRGVMYGEVLKLIVVRVTNWWAGIAQSV
jgi:hypothetical protein